MVSSTSTLAPLTRWHVLPAIAKLAGWRFKQMWRFLFVTWLGMLAMVVLICALPLFSQVAVTVDLHTVAANAPEGPNLLFQVESLAPTVAQIQQIGQQLSLVLKQRGLDAYLQGSPRLIVRTPPLTMLARGGSTPAALLLTGYDPAQAAGHTIIVQGRLPQQTTDGSLEIALPQALAQNLGVHTGTTIQGRYPATFGAQLWTLRIVGLIAPRSAHDAFWLPAANPFGTQSLSNVGLASYNVLAASAALQAKIADVQATSSESGVAQSAFSLFWSYPVDTTRIDAHNVNSVSQNLDLFWPLSTSVSRIPGVTFVTPFGSLYSTLVNYEQQNVVLAIMLMLLLLLVLAIVLFLVGMLADMLVERQAVVIATLRSRGATRQQVFGSFVLQSAVLSLFAVLAGPLLAIQLVRVMAQVLLTPANQSALGVITANPLQAALGVKWYALPTALVALGVMVLAVSRATKLDIVTLRHESSRTKQVPLWRRLHLDLLVLSLLALGAAVYNYLWQSLLATQAFDPTLYNILKVGSFLAPPLLIAATLLLFLRVFPWLLRLATSVASKKRGASAVLAFAQMERMPRPAARIVVLLALTVASSCFLLTLMTTTQARASDAATFAVGADFSGSLPASNSSKPLSVLKTQYSHLSGVQSAAIGYSAQIARGEGDISLTAVDPDTYAHTALWLSQNSPQSLSQLAAQLAAHRAAAATNDVVYAVVDAALWQQFQLSQGASFVLPLDNGLAIRFIAIAEVSALPGAYDTPVNPGNGIGLLVDYSSYATVYAKETGQALAPNFVWLRVHNDPGSLASLRQALPSLQDRLQLTANNQENAVHIDIIGVLAIAVGAALLLALIGTLLASWLHASSWSTNVAIARALGMAPRQVVAVLFWEQGFVYIVALFLGTALGALLTLFVAPAVSLLDLTIASNQSNPFDVPAVQAVIPYGQLLWLLGGLLILCFVALLLMVRIVSRPSLGQTLRLNED